MSDKRDNKAFEMMTAEADKTNVDLSRPRELEFSRDDLHTVLQAAGLSPGIGNIADATDAVLYALEGEFGEAAISAASMIPVAGQMVAGKRAIKAAEEAGEEIVTLYRGVKDWYPGKMVKDGKFVGGGDWGGDIIPLGGARPKKISNPEAVWTSSNIRIADLYAGNVGPILEFKIPKSFLTKYSKLDDGHLEEAYVFSKGIPKEFLTKVHNGFNRKIGLNVNRFSSSSGPGTERILHQVASKIKNPEDLSPPSQELRLWGAKLGIDITGQFKMKEETSKIVGEFF